MNHESNCAIYTCLHCGLGKDADTHTAFMALCEFRPIECDCEIRTMVPTIALSIRQPWAWAIIYGSKDIENRSTFAITKGDMKPRRIAIHASQRMTKDEYDHAANFMATLGIECPRPDALDRGGIIGACTVRAIVSKHESPWFFGPRGLVLDEKDAFDPIPCSGALGYFQWKQSGSLIEPLPWMKAWPIRAAAKAPAGPSLGPLFDDGGVK